MKKAFILTAFVLCIGIGSQAVAEVIFSDNFVNVAAGSAPVAQVGSWDAATDATVNFDGALECERTETASPQAWANFTQPTTTGEEIHIDVQLNMDVVAGGFSPQFGLWATGTAVNTSSGDRRFDSVLLVAIASGSTDVWYYGDANGDGTSTWQSTGLNFTAANTWDQFEVDYVSGGSTFDLTIAGNTAAGLGTNRSGVDVQGMFFSTDDNGAGTYLIDNLDITIPTVEVPEPGALCILLGGAIFLAFSRRRT